MIPILARISAAGSRLTVASCHAHVQPAATGNWPRARCIPHAVAVPFLRSFTSGIACRNLEQHQAEHNAASSAQPFLAPGFVFTDINASPPSPPQDDND